MARKRFTAAEKTLAVPGTAVEWRNGSQWHPAVAVGGVSIDGWQYVQVRTLTGTRTFSRGDVIPCSPGAVRAA